MAKGIPADYFLSENKNEKLTEKNKTPTVGIQTLYILKLEIQRTNYMTLDIEMTQAIPTARKISKLIRFYTR